MRVDEVPPGVGALERLDRSCGIAPDLLATDYYLVKGLLQR